MQPADQQKEIEQKEAEITRLQENLKKEKAEADDFSKKLDGKAAELTKFKLDSAKKHKEDIEKYTQEQQEFTKNYKAEKREWQKTFRAWDREKAELNAKMETIKTQAKVDNHSTYTFTNAAFPESIAKAQAELAGTQMDNYRAQTKKVEYENSWTKMSFDFAGGTGAHIIAPLLVQGSLPVIHNWRRENYPTAIETLEKEILQSRKTSAANDLLLQAQTIKHNEATKKQSEELFESEQYSKEVIQFRHLCDGNNASNVWCQQIGDMHAAIARQTAAERYQKKFGKPYVAPKA